MDLSWLRPFLAADFEADLDALWARFAATVADPNPHTFVAFLFHEGQIPGKTARQILISGDASLTLSGRIGKGQRHEELGVIGRGAMGEVVVARDTTLRRTVALKRHLGEKGGAQFLAEAQITAQLDHPGIVPVYGFEGDGKLAYSMKLIAGGNLSGFLADTRDFYDDGERPDAAHALEARLELFLHVCDAIAYAHDHGAMHRDLKPDNIMVGDFSEVLVADWGIGHLAGADDPAPSEESIARKSTSEMSGPILGTPPYMSPEQAAGNAHALRPASDQYALGLILFELVSLRKANRAADPWEAIRQAREGRKDPMEHYAKGTKIHPALAAIVLMATRPWPGDRYDSVQALAADVRRFLRGEEVRAWPDTPVRATWRRLQRHPVAVMTGLLVIVLLAATLTTTSLLAVLETERRAEEDRRNLAQLVGTITQHVQNFDRQFVEVELLLEGLSVAVASRLDLPAAGFQADPYRHSDLGTERGPADAAPSERYGQVITMEHVIYVVSDGVPPAQLLESRQRLGDIDEVMKSILVRSAGADPSELPPEDRAALFRSGVPVMWAYLQLENGLMINFPGNANYPDQYDGRLRTWYRDVLGTRGPRWGQLYPDGSGSGFLLPCNQAIYDSGARFVGVAGLDFSMDHLIATMEVAGIAGLEDALLIDREGDILVSSLERGIKSEVSMQGHRTKERRPIGVDGLAAAARRGSASGFVLDGDDLYVFAALGSVPWLLVVRLDAASHGLR
jgi:serine/threonine-protein kinase